MCKTISFLIFEFLIMQIIQFINDADKQLNTNKLPKLLGKSKINVKRLIEHLISDMQRDLPKD